MPCRLPEFRNRHGTTRLVTIGHVVGAPVGTSYVPLAAGIAHDGVDIPVPTTTHPFRPRRKVQYASAGRVTVYMIHSPFAIAAPSPTAACGLVRTIVQRLIVRKVGSITTVRCLCEYCPSAVRPVRIVYLVYTSARSRSYCDHTGHSKQRTSCGGCAAWKYEEDRKCDCSDGRQFLNSWHDCSLWTAGTKGLKVSSDVLSFNQDSQIHPFGRLVIKENSKAVDTAYRIHERGLVCSASGAVLHFFGPPDRLAAVVLDHCAAPAPVGLASE